MRLKRSFSLLPFVVFMGLGTGVHGDDIETARAVAVESGWLSRLMIPSLKEWAELTGEQIEIFNKVCRYNGTLLEITVCDGLVERFSEEELGEVLGFVQSSEGRKWQELTKNKGNDSPEIWDITKKWRKSRSEDAYNFRMALPSGKKSPFLQSKPLPETQQAPSADSQRIRKSLRASGIADKLMAFMWTEWRYMDPAKKDEFERVTFYDADSLFNLLEPFIEAHLTPKELDGVIRFYESSTGRKWLDYDVGIAEALPRIWEDVGGWRFYRDMELIAFSKAISKNRSWSPAGYRAQLPQKNDLSAPPFKGGVPLNILGKKLEDLYSVFGYPAMVEERTAAVLAVDTWWPPYKVSAELLNGKIATLHFSRTSVLAENENPADPTPWPIGEVESFMNAFRGRGFWTPWVALGNKIEGHESVNKAEQISCKRTPHSIHFYSHGWHDYLGLPRE